MKCPRTYHLPYSPRATKDDKKLKDGWFDYFKNQEIVITEKLDGENDTQSISTLEKQQFNEILQFN